MFKFVVAGITQLETIVKVPQLPIEFRNFTDAHDSIYVSGGGDAFNESLALKWLGDEVSFMTVVGKDQDMGIFIAVSPSPQSMSCLSSLRLPRSSCSSTKTARCRFLTT